MAATEELELDDNPGKKKKLIIIIAIVVLLAGGGGAAFFMMGGEEPVQAELDGAEESSTENEGEAAMAADGAPVMGSAVYVPMPRPFRFNVPGAAQDRFVEIRVQLLVRGVENEELAKKHIPLIESTLLGVFSQSTADDLSTSAGKTAIKQKSLEEIHKTLIDIEDNKIVEKVLFTGFVMQ